MAAQWLLMTCIAAAGQAPQPHGSIGGVVLNATRGGTPVPQADVALRIRAGGQLALLRETKSDAEGRFFFPHLPVGRDFRYLPGATRDGVHYPGPAIVLTTQHSHAIVELTVNDAVAGPCPLIIRRQRVSLYPEPGLLRVEESLLIDNPSASCYVGVTTSDNAAPVTLRLGIPADFSTITFNDDFFGRRFSLVGGKLVTGIPWTPGSRELKFTYVLRNSQRSSAWERSLDLPCEDLRVEVHTETPDEIGRGVRVLSIGRRGAARGPTDPRPVGAATGALDRLRPLALAACAVGAGCHGRIFHAQAAEWWTAGHPRSGSSGR